MTMSNNENEKLKLYTQICADTYGEDLSHNKNSLVCRLGFNPTT